MSRDSSKIIGIIVFSLSWVRCFPKDLEKPDPRKGKETTQCRGHQRFSFANAWVSHAPLHHHPCSPASGLREGKDSLPQSHFSSLRENGRYQRPHPSFFTIDPLRDHPHPPLISTIIEPVEPHGLAGLSYAQRSAVYIRCI